MLSLHHSFRALHLHPEVREQHFRQDYDSQTRFNLHPFGETCFVVLQKPARFNSVTDTAERAIYMFNGQYNVFFSHLVC